MSELHDFGGGPVPARRHTNPDGSRTASELGTVSWWDTPLGVAVRTAYARLDEQANP